jgi:hypothetical protein
MSLRSEFWFNGAHITADTRTAIKEFVENYDRVKEMYGCKIIEPSS